LTPNCRVACSGCGIEKSFECPVRIHSKDTDNSPVSELPGDADGNAESLPSVDASISTVSKSAGHIAEHDASHPDDGADKCIGRRPDEIYKELTEEAAPIGIRLKFARGEEVKYISHLDLMRAFARAFRRGQIPVSYSKGFNPHAIMVFGLPLQVGVTSECEYLDISIEASLAPESLIAILNAHLPKGIEILEAMLRLDKTNIMSQVSLAEYIVTLVETPAEIAEEQICVHLLAQDRMPTQGSLPVVHCLPVQDRLPTQESLSYLEHIVSDFLGSNECLVKKTTKKGTREIDIRPLVKRLEVVTPESGSHLTLRMLLAAGSKMNLKPELLLSHLGLYGDGPIKTVSIHRTGLII